VKTSSRKRTSKYRKVGGARPERGGRGETAIGGREGGGHHHGGKKRLLIALRTRGGSLTSHSRQGLKEKKDKVA